MADGDQPRAEDIDPDDLVSLTAQEKLDALPYVVDLLGPLLRAYNHGMIVAGNDEERAILDEIAAANGPPDPTAA